MYLSFLKIKKNKQVFSILFFLFFSFRGLAFCCVTLQVTQTKGYSFNFDLTGQNTKKQAKPLFPVGESRSFFFSAMQKRRILIGKAYPEEKKRISKPFVKKASSVSK